MGREKVLTLETKEMTEYKNKEVDLKGDDNILISNKDCCGSTSP